VLLFVQSRTAIATAVAATAGYSTLFGLACRVS